jgi:DNA-binding NarL/FixJ family response regulator
MSSTLSTPRIRVAVAHEDPYLAAGISALLRAGAQFDVLSDDEDGPSPDVVVMDYAAAVGQPASAPGRRPGKRSASLVVTDQCTGWQVRRAVDVGVRGYLLHGCSADELAGAVRCLAQGGRYLPIPVAQQLADSLSYGVPTARELDVLKLTAKGLCNKDIGRHLGVGEGTVKTHMKALFEKLGAASRTAAVTEALRRGLLSPLPAPAAG